MDTRIRKFVSRVRARLREQQIVTNLIECTVVGMLIAVIISLIALVTPFYHAPLLAVGMIVITFFAGIVRGVCKTPKMMEAALQIDALGYQEKISTALYLRGKEDTFSVLQKKDAVRIVDSFQIRKEFPIHLQWKKVGVLLLFTVAFVVTSLLDTPAKRTAGIRHDVKKEAKEAITQLEKIEKEIADNREIPENETTEVKEQLENAKRELKDAESYEELSKAEERITKKMEMMGKNVQNKTLGDVMNQAVEERTGAAKKKEKKLAEEAKEALDKAAKGDEKQKEDAYEKMKKLAEMTGNSKLEQVAENYKNSDYSDIDYAASAQAVADAVENMDNIKQKLVSNSTEKDTNKKSSNNNSANNTNSNNTNQSSSNNTANLNNNSGSNTVNGNSNNNSNSGNNSANGKKSNNVNGNQNSNQNKGISGQGNSNQNGQSGSGNAGSGSGNGSGGGGNGGDGWNYGSKDGQEGARKTAENITVPEGEIGEDENLTGKANGNDTSTKEKSDQSQTWSGNKVSYGEVSAEYKEKAYNKINGSNYPGKMKDKIRDYFDGLN